MQLTSYTHLYEGQHLVMYNGWGVVFRKDGSYQYTFYKILASNEYVEAVAAIFDTCFKNLRSKQDVNVFGSSVACSAPPWSQKKDKQFEKTHTSLLA